MGILDEYKQQLEKDRQNEETVFPEGNEWSETERAEYVKRVNELRNDPNDMENAYRKKMSEMSHLTEEEMTTQNLIVEEDVDKVIVKHAYCSECGEELISEAPPMFNPFTFERICRHTCKKCGKMFNLEFAYPRLAFINKDGVEIPAFTR